VLPDGRIVLNSANEQELCRLRGIGPSRAHAIVALRQRLGRFRSPRDLLRVKGIGARTLAKFSAQLVVDDPRVQPDAGASRP
jgi:competence protein ComEA